MLQLFTIAAGIINIRKLYKLNTVVPEVSFFVGNPDIISVFKENTRYGDYEILI